MQRRHFIFSIPVAITGLITAPASAADKKTLDAPEVIFSRLLKIIDQAGTIIPGEGFKSIKLGDPVEKLIRLWGRPKNIDRNGTLSYLLSQKTVIQFLGKTHIESIIVQGKAGSLARVNNGVIFGMTQEQVLSRFGITPDKINPEFIRYNSLGIELGFNSGRLAELGIFQA